MDAAIVAAMITAAVALLAYVGDRYRESLQRRREVAAEAMAHALLWLELPYRIRRRVDDKPETIAAIVERVHGLQEKLVFHSSWLEVELPMAQARSLAGLSPAGALPLHAYPCLVAQPGGGLV